MIAPQPGPRGPISPGWYPTPYGMQWWDGFRWLPPQTATKMRSAPVTGWVLLAFGGLLAIGAFLPWATALGGSISKSGLDGASDGVITLVIGLAVAGLGVVIGVKQGHLSVPIIASVLGALATLTAIVDASDVGSKGLGITVGSGLWLTMIAGTGCVVAGLIACFVRVRAA